MASALVLPVAQVVKHVTTDLNDLGSISCPWRRSRIRLGLLNCDAFDNPYKEGMHEFKEGDSCLSTSGLKQLDIILH